MGKTIEDPTPETRFADVLAKVEGLLDGDEGVDAIRDKVKALEAEVEEFKGLDRAKVLEELDGIKTAQKQLSEKIRTSKSGFYVPGLEDQGEEFSLQRAMVGVLTKNWKGAEHEKEVMDEVRTKAAQSVGDDSLGGYFVPDQVIGDVIAAIYTKSAFINLDGNGETTISVIGGLAGPKVEVPKVEGGTVAYWIGEEDAYAESEMRVGDMTMSAKKLGVLVKITDAMRRWGAYGFESLLRRDMTAAAAKKLDWTIAYGTGSDNMPKGITKHAGIKVYRAEDGTVYANVAAAKAAGSWAGAEADFDDLDEMRGALEDDDIDLPERTGRFVWAPKYKRRLKQFKVDNYSSQTERRPYLLGLPIIPDSRLAESVGPFSQTTQIPTNQKAGATFGLATNGASGDALKHTDIFYGNLGEVVLGRWGGIEIVDDGGRGTGFANDTTLVKLRLYADVGIRQERAIIVCPDALARN